MELTVLHLTDPHVYADEEAANDMRHEGGRRYKPAATLRRVLEAASAQARDREHAEQCRVISSNYFCV